MRSGAGRAGHRRGLAFVAAVVVAVTACTTGGDGGDRATARKAGGDIERVTLDSRSLSDAGRRLARQAGLESAPVYDVRAVVQPESGRVEGSLVAELPAGRDPLRFRVFPALPALDTGFRLQRVEVGGEEVEPALDRSLLTLPRPPGEGEGRVEVRLDFRYTVGVTKGGDDPFAALAGTDLEPAEIGLLGRHGGGLALGHWFPVWIAPGGRHDADPGGFGDIANFPAALIAARIEVPAGWSVFSGGVTTDRETDGGRTVYSEEGAGLRDLGVYIGRAVDVRESRAGDATVRVVSQTADAPEAAEVEREAGDALSALSDAFGPYPWAELDVVDVPLGSGVGGMEWPGMVWVSQSFFGGGLPGLGGLEGLSGLEDLLRGLGGVEGLGDLGGLFDPQVLGSLRAFVVAHEVAHEWWHALVGNDSIGAPVVDEPLAQFSACVVFRARAPEQARRACEFNTAGQYRLLRAVGAPDGRADQPTTDFASSHQYGAVVYGKAPELFERLRSLVGDEATLAALRRYAEANAFRVATPGGLRDALVSAAPSRSAEIDALWRRWMEEAHGDEDLGTGAAGVGGTGGSDQIADALARLLQALERD
ncbi:MAG TPA: M1 family aminopeptidase [Acidimicrobiales bacterium]|nr:M1 family aminopeptidase [Acidimicrobiales bacterium]